MMTSSQVVETSVNVTSNSPSQDYTHPDDHNLPNYDVTPGFKPFTVFEIYYITKQRLYKELSINKVFDQFVLRNNAFFIFACAGSDLDCKTDRPS